MQSLKRSDFPKDFVFGTATSSYQIEGHQFGGAGQTHWDSFAATPGNVVRRENGALACDHYNRFEEDLDLVKAGGFDAYRFSTSWARVFPDGKGAPNAEGLDFYDRLVDAICARDLKPFLTLYHWELPQALADIGGWRNREIPERFAEFAQVLMRRIGDRVAGTATINEPWCVSWLSHFEGHHAPGLRDIRAAARAMHHVLLAHGMAVEAMRAEGLGNLGAVFNMEWAEPHDTSAGAAEAAANYEAIYNRFFVSGVFRGTYPNRVLAGLGPYLPENWQDDMATISAPVDWCGVNYYTRQRLVWSEEGWPNYAPVPGPLQKTQMGWEIFPKGLEHVLRLAHEYCGDIPMFVTENGLASPDSMQAGAINDDLRIAYIEAHLQTVRDVLRDGLPISGYFVWSLLDNFEWALGYEKRFGLVHVDFDTLVRTPKRSFEMLSEALRA